MLPLLDLHSSSCILPSKQLIAAGEVISAAQAAERSAVYNAMDQRHTYFMHLRYSFWCRNLCIISEMLAFTVHDHAPVIPHVFLGCCDSMQQQQQQLMQSFNCMLAQANAEMQHSLGLESAVDMKSLMPSTRGTGLVSSITPVNPTAKPRSG